MFNVEFLLPGLRVISIRLPEEGELYGGAQVLAHFVFEGREIVPINPSEEESHVAMEIILVRIAPWLSTRFPISKMLRTEGWPNSLSLPKVSLWGAAVVNRSKARVDVIIYQKDLFDEGTIREFQYSLRLFVGDDSRIRKPASETHRSIILEVSETPEGWLKTVARYYGLTEDEMKSASRNSKISRARHVLFYLLKKHKRYLTYTDIAKLVGKDHTSVIHGVRRIKRELKTDESLRHELGLLS